MKEFPPLVVDDIQSFGSKLAQPKFIATCFHSFLCLRTFCVCKRFVVQKILGDFLPYFQAHLDLVCRSVGMGMAVYTTVCVWRDRDALLFYSAEQSQADMARLRQQLSTSQAELKALREECDYLREEWEVCLLRLCGAVTAIKLT
jgi:hypothetical protein